MRLKRGFSSGRAEAGMRLEHAERKLRGASTKAHPDQPAEAQRQVEAAKEKVEIAERRAAGDEALKREREEIERSIAIAKASWK